MNRSKNRSVPFMLIAAALTGIAACNGTPPDSVEGTTKSGPGWKTVNDGVVVSFDNAEFRRVRLQVVDDGIIRVTATPQEDFSNLPDTLMIVAGAPDAGFRAEQRGNEVVVQTGALEARVSLATGTVRFTDSDGNELLAEAERSLAPVTADPGATDDDSFFVRQQFQRATDEDEGIYGFGQQQDGRVNYAGRNVELTTHNIEIAIPFFASSRGYGVLWNNTSITRFGDPEPPRPLSAGFRLFDANGEPGGLTARYYAGGELKLEQVEPDLNYQFLSHANVREIPLPEEVRDSDDVRIEWEGSFVPSNDGIHELK
ncbi:MAG TPA: hypothetical protein VFY27_12290, partial [Woeseiaceae bacterium]|nr:hypothetical protein [Woeseiaceae bacterium]